MKLTIQILFFALLNRAYTQDSWIELKNPQSGILGRKVQSINGGDIKYEPFASPTIITSNSYQSAESIDDYREQIGTFFSKLVQNEKVKIKGVSIKNMIIKSLSFESVKNLDPGSKYIYEAISADTVVLSITKKRETEVNFEELSKLVTESLGDRSSELIGSFIPVFEDMSYKSSDSVQYKMTISNPNVYYKVRVIKYNNIVDADWNNIWKYFLLKSNKKNSITTLTTSVREIQNETPKIYPEFVGKLDNKDLQFKISLEKDSILHLYIKAKGIDQSGNWKNIKEIPFITDAGTQIWRMDQELVHTFYYNGVVKKTYVTCFAIQKNTNSVEVINWRGNKKVLADAKTYIQYPEIKFEYITE